MSKPKPKKPTDTDTEMLDWIKDSWALVERWGGFWEIQWRNDDTRVRDRSLRSAIRKAMEADRG